jgi:hypothetical protein
MEANLESVKITIELLKDGARGKSELCKRAQGKYRLRNMWLFYTVKWLLFLLPFAALAYILLK